MKLRLWEFLKSLRDHVHTWYLNLKPGYIHDWVHIVSTFNTKFFIAEVNHTLAELGHTRQYPSEDLDLYVKEVHEKALDCSKLIGKEVLVNVCFHGMADEYHVFLKNLSFPFFPSWWKHLGKQTSSWGGLQSWVKPILQRDFPMKEADSRSGWKGLGIKNLKSQKAFLQVRLQARTQAEMEVITCLTAFSLWHGERHSVARTMGESLNHFAVTCRANAIPSRQEDAICCPYHWRRETPSNSAWPSEECLTRNSKTRVYTPERGSLLRPRATFLDHNNYRGNGQAMMVSAS